MATVSIAPVRPHRFAEILLMVLALALGIGGYALTTLNRTGEVPSDLGRHVAVLVGVAVIAEVGMHLLAPYADPVILPVAVALTGIGLAMIYRLDLSYAALDRPTVGLRQLMFVGIGLACAAVVLLVLRDHRVLRRYTYTFGVLSLILLLLPMVPGIGTESYGARVWIHLGPLSLQPGELVKITLAVFFAGYLVGHRDNLAIGGPKILGMRLPRARDLGPILVVWLIGIAILVLQRDLGTSLLFFGLFVAMLYVATNRVSWLVIGIALFAPAVLVAVRVFSHVQQRFTTWLHAMDQDVYDAQGGSNQLVTGLFGQASGGLMGTGWGRGYPQLVPLANSDFILSSLAEELGLTGLLAILMLYLVLIERGLRAAIGVRDGFGKLLASGLSFSLALQVFVVLGGITRVIPLTGLTAPFLAAGGSSMVSSWLIVAVLVRISDAARRPAASPAPWTTGVQAAIEAVVPASSRPARPSAGSSQETVAGWTRGVDEGGPAARGSRTGGETR
ncbi:MAG: FtsW/RodA/SpoVE family cell cycle protein [Actinomyces sp.]|jgi:cell division protein FtsW (lipid II flippase)|nr:FtsW/RodA/SpoVE family cell cycle protein [Actinomyces sp.]MCI1788919.1 FtsW/RodA/SpoVE family cell cycle protein [Actinomyces sp.]MCI1830881.1 FtsW/RodA/SpoVE family cell cycle protein [Actinomyces sp.]